MEVRLVCDITDLHIKIFGATGYLRLKCLVTEVYITFLNPVAFFVVAIYLHSIVCWLNYSIITKGLVKTCLVFLTDIQFSPRPPGNST